MIIYVILTNISIQVRRNDRSTEEFLFNFRVIFILVIACGSQNTKSPTTRVVFDPTLSPDKYTRLLSAYP